MTICKRCKSEKTYLISEEKFHNVFKCLDCSYMYAYKFNDYCCQNPFLNITIDNKNPEKIRLHRQCQNCGGCIDRTKPLSHKKYGNEIRFEFSFENYKKWQLNIKEEEKILCGIGLKKIIMKPLIMQNIKIIYYQINGK